MLRAKADAGADFAITELFFRPIDYVALVERVRRSGSEMPIIPGIMPITAWQIQRFAELSGRESRPDVVRRFDGVTDPADVRERGSRSRPSCVTSCCVRGHPGCTSTR